MKIVTTSTFKDLVEQLKVNEKAGKGDITSLVLSNGFFRAVLEEGENSKYSQALASLTGDETDNIQDKIDFLMSVESKFLDVLDKDLDEKATPVSEELLDRMENIKAVSQQTETAPEGEPKASPPKAKRTRRNKTPINKGE